MVLTNFFEIEDILNTLKIDVLFVSEWLTSKRVWLNPTNKNILISKIVNINIKLKKFKFTASSSCTGFLYRKNLNFKNLNIESHFINKKYPSKPRNIPKVTMANLKLGTLNLQLVSCYRSQTTKPKDILKLYLPHISSENVIFGGDFNLKHSLLGDDIQNKESIEFMDCLDETDYFIITPPEETHSKGGHLDFFFCLS